MGMLDISQPDGGGGRGQGGRGAGVGDVEPASAVSRVELTAGFLPGNFIRGHEPLAGRVSLAGNIC